MLTVLGWIADIERDLTRTRTTEARERMANGEALTDIARTYAVSI